MIKYILIILLIIFSIGIGIVSYYHVFNNSKNPQKNKTNSLYKGSIIYDPNPLSIEYMRKQKYPGSAITIEQTLPDGLNYYRFITSYKSDGLKIYALLTVPYGNKPKTGWPVIILNHGYIPPEQYRTTERYLAYTDVFSRNGYIVFKSDYRGHGISEGKPEGAYYSPAYTIDILNAVSSIKKYKDADPKRIGMWGHSMGGTITLRTMVVIKDIKAADIWAGVVASYEDMTNNWHHPDINSRPFTPSQREQASKRPGKQELIKKYGDFKTNPLFWNSISPISFVKDISGPIQLQHSTTDNEVPLLFSQKLNDALNRVNKPVKLYTYQEDDHNLSNNLSIALQRSVEFFDTNVKGK